MPYILPGVFKHCDLGHIVQSQHVPLGFTTDCVIVFIFDLIVKPNTFSFIKNLGRYMIEIFVSSSDSNKPIKRNFELIIPNNWYEDEDKMLSNVIIKPT